jgi:hypothetical protein
VHDDEEEIMETPEEKNTDEKIGSTGVDFISASCILVSLILLIIIIPAITIVPVICRLMGYDLCTGEGFIHFVAIGIVTLIFMDIFLRNYRP